MPVEAKLVLGVDVESARREDRPLEDKGSITHWIHEIKSGESAAANALWEHYFEKLVRLARRKLDGVPRRIADEEDVALSAFDSFCRAAKKGRFPDLADRDGLWRLLIQMTARKAVDLIRYNSRQKRKVLGESVLGKGESTDAQGIAQVIGDEPTPEFAAMVTEEYERLLALLEDPELEAIAVAKMEGFENTEIARKHGCAVRTVERQLHLIRRKWEQERPA